MTPPRWTAPRVLFLVGDASGCSVWRVFQPVAELQRQGAPVGAVEWGWKDDNRLGDLVAHFDAVILPRLSWRPGDRLDARLWFDGLRRAGKLVWYELDDDLVSPWITNQQERGGLVPELDAEAKEAARLGRLAALRLCDGVTVTSQRLATVVRNHTDAPVEVIPNAIDWRWFKATIKQGGPRRVPPLTVGWAGGARPDADLEAMAWAWGELAQTHPEVSFVVQGHQPKPIHAALPASRIRALPWMPLEAYPVGLANIDIACCPLADAPFNRCKSGIKVWEAAACGSAVVASPTIYRQTIESGEDGYLCETGEEWLAALTRLVEDEGERRRVGGNLRRRVATEHALEANAWRWPVAWARLYERCGEARRAA
jgi:glycosyltransferase involved in cell wall biosynthesis